MKWLIRIGTHLAALGLGFALGIYFLPILIAPDAPEDALIRSIAAESQFEGQFQRDLPGSDSLHWGEGTLYLTSTRISLEGKLAPGPDYKLYLSPEFVDTEAAFLSLKNEMVQVGPVQTFENFVVPVSGAVDLTAFNTAVVWCESFGQFITAAKYR